jgi:hypothetical protein
MLDIVLTFEVVLLSGKTIQGSAVRVESIEVDDHPSVDGLDTSLDLTSVDRVILSDGQNMDVYWADDLFGPSGDPRILKHEPRAVAVLLAYDHPPFVLRTEPTLDGRLGITIEEHGKVRFVGRGDLLETEDGIEFVSSGKEIYPFRPGNPSGCGCAHTDWAKRKKGSRPTAEPARPQGTGSQR